MPRLKKNIDRVYAELVSILIFAFGILSFLSLYGSAAGAVGESLARIYTQFAGSAAFAIPVVLLYYSLRGLFVRKKAGRRHGFGLILILLVVFTVFSWTVPADKLLLYGEAGEAGGLIGSYLTYWITNAFGRSGGQVVLGASALAGFVLVTGLSVRDIVRLIKMLAIRIFQSVVGFFGVLLAPFRHTGKRTRKRKIVDFAEETATSGEQPEQEVKKEPEKVKEKVREEVPETPTQLSLDGLASYRLPPADILRKRVRLKSTRHQKDLAEKADLLEGTLRDFGVSAEVVRVRRGPTITRYEVQPKAGVKVSRISNLADDIALSLAAETVRIEAPIPGKSVVGIEVPNPMPSTVYLREVIESSAFSASPSKLSLALGKDITGQPVIGDLATMPHLLVAGATGSGKSVCINCIVASILFKASPNDVKFIMIDPKVVELSAFNGIPHLAAPVITDPKRATGVLKWAQREMERRYELFAEAGQRDITRYNRKLAREGKEEERLPLVVVIIDELADLMMVAPNKVEDAICRLAQMARAAGIHLVIGTQRPSVDIITGVIKANIPSRIAFAVSSQTDSRTILDMGGAEKLLGRGDMLFSPVGAPKAVRVQGSYISDNEVGDLVDYARSQQDPQYQEEILREPETSDVADDEDDLLWEAAELVVSMGQASASALQRRFRIGYSRAGRIIDQLERMGLVGPHEGSKPRKVLVDEGALSRIMDERGVE